MRAWFFHELRVVPREYILPSLYIYRGGFLLYNTRIIHIYANNNFYVNNNCGSFFNCKYRFIIGCYIHAV